MTHNRGALNLNSKLCQSDSYEKDSERYSVYNRDDFFFFENKEFYATFQTWEESIAASVDLISHVGALSKNKGMDFEENYSFLVTNPFDLERLKRQLNNLFERIARMIQEGSVEIQEDSRKDVEISDWLNEASPTVMEN